MKNWQRALFVVLAIVGILLTLQINGALALTGVEECPDGNPDAFRDNICQPGQEDGCTLPNQNICIGLVELTDMGTFDENGVFTWHQAFIDEFGGWGNHPDDWQDRHMPRQLPSGVEVDESRLDFKQFPDGSIHTRLAVVLRENIGGYEIPHIWKVTGPNGEEYGYFIGNYVPPEGCDMDNPDWENPDSPCNQQWIDLDFEQYGGGGGQVPSDRMGDVTWHEQGLTIPMSIIDQYEMYNVNYNNDRTIQNWEASLANPFVMTDHYYKFPDGTKPALGTNTFTLQYDDKTIDLNFNVVSTEPMPVVPATYMSQSSGLQCAEPNCEKKLASGKKVKAIATDATEVEVDNIIVRELNGALVVQWAEPDLALFPDPFANRIELRMFVGRDLANDVNWGGPSLWVAAPYQTGSIVVPDYAFSFIKNEIKTRYPDDTNLLIQFQYRFKYFTDGTSGSTQNRGYADRVTIPLN